MKSADGHGGVLAANAAGRPVRRSGAEMAHLKSFVPMLMLMLAPQRSACTGIEPGASRTGLWLTPCMPLHGGEAATVTPSDNKNMLIQAGTALAGSGSAR